MGQCSYSRDPRAIGGRARRLRSYLRDDGVFVGKILSQPGSTLDGIIALPVVWQRGRNYYVKASKLGPGYSEMFNIERMAHSVPVG